LADTAANGRRIPTVVGEESSTVKARVRLDSNLDVGAEDPADQENGLFNLLKIAKIGARRAPG